MVGLFYVDTKVIILRKLEFTAYPNFSAVDSNQRINSTSLTLPLRYGASNSVCRQGEELDINQYLSQAQSDVTGKHKQSPKTSTN
jgi:hypothetical protein